MKTKIILSSLFLFCAILAYSQDSPYSMFGDNTKTLMTKYESNADYTLKIPLVKGDESVGFFELNMQTGFVEVKDNDCNILLTKQLTSEERARFMTMDPLSEKYYSISPYAYCLNNPLKFVDPTGMATHVNSSGRVIYISDDDDLGIYQHSTLPDNYKDNAPLSKEGDGIKKVGETWTALGFANFEYYEKTGKIIVAGGAMIDFNSDWATDAVEGIVSENPSLMEYQSKAGSDGDWDLKTKAPNENRSYGSKLYGKYASARDAGNFAAGIVSVKSIVPTSIVDMGYGAYNMTGNSKIGAGLITYGVSAVSVIAPGVASSITQLIGRHGEDKLSKAGITAGQNYMRSKK